MSASKDGKILIWNPQPGKNQLKLVDGFRMLIDCMPNSQFRSRGIEMGGNYLPNFILNDIFSFE